MSKLESLAYLLCLLVLRGGLENGRDVFVKA